jgi:hypothetical protein
VPPLLKQLNYIFFDRPLFFLPPLKTLAEALRTDIDWVREHTRIGEAALRYGRGRAEALLFRGDELAAAKAHGLRPHRNSRPSRRCCTMSSSRRRKMPTPRAHRQSDNGSTRWLRLRMSARRR